MNLTEKEVRYLKYLLKQIKIWNAGEALQTEFINEAYGSGIIDIQDDEITQLSQSKLDQTFERLLKKVSNNV